MTTLAEIATRLNGAKLQPNGSYKALCPYHDDTERSLHVGPGVGFYCYGCGKQGYIKELAECLGLVDKEYFVRRPRNKASTLKASSTITKGVMVNTYDYRDANGYLMYQVVRYDPKDFRCRRPKKCKICSGKGFCWETNYLPTDGVHHPSHECPACRGTGNKGGWIWNMFGVQRILYRLPELLKRPNDVVIYVEGEKDADTLHELGYLATTVAGGIQSLRYTSLRHLDRRRVILIPDCHAVGKEYMGNVRGRLVGRADRAVIIRLPGELGDGGWDVTDWLEAGHTGDELKQLIEEALE